jgi:hypothetical protein
VVVGVEMRLGHRGPGVAVLEVGRADVEQLRQRGHARFVGVIEVDPDESILGSDRIRGGRLGYVDDAGGREKSATHGTAPFP